MNKDLVKENNQKNNYKNTAAANLNIDPQNSYEPNNNIDLVSRNNFNQQNVASNYPNIDHKIYENPNNSNDVDQKNAQNEEDITDANINTLDETVAETLVNIFLSYPVHQLFLIN